jgi:hypothetical protein
MPPPKRNLIGQEVQKLGGAGPAAFLMRLVFPMQFGRLTQNTRKDLVKFDQKLLALAEKGDPNKYLPRQSDPYYSITMEDGTKKKVYMSDAEKDKFDRLTGEYLWERMQESDYFTKDGPLDAEDIKEFKKHARDSRAEARDELRWDAEEEEAD